MLSAFERGDWVFHFRSKSKGALIILGPSKYRQYTVAKYLFRLWKVKASATSPYCECNKVYKEGFNYSQSWGNLVLHKRVN